MHPGRPATRARTQDRDRPLLSPLHTHVSSPETPHTRSPGSIHELRVTHQEPTIGAMSDAEQEREEARGRDPVQWDQDELARLASGMDAVGRSFPDTRRSAEFLTHANTSLHSLLSRHGTLLEHHHHHHPAADSGPPTASTSGFPPTGHIVAPGSASSSDLTDLDVLKPPRNADDEYLTRMKQLFTTPEERAWENERIVGRMHRWMDELVVMQEGIAALHIKLEGVAVDGEGLEGTAREADGKETTRSDGKQAREEAEEKREDRIMDQMIEQVGPPLPHGCHNLAPDASRSSTNYSPNFKIFTRPRTRPLHFRPRARRRHRPSTPRPARRASRTRTMSANRGSDRPGSRGRIAPRVCACLLRRCRARPRRRPRREPCGVHPSRVRWIRTIRGSFFGRNNITTTHGIHSRATNKADVTAARHGAYTLARTPSIVALRVDRTRS